MSATFIPDAGDLMWLTSDPQAGREQAGRRPALVLSSKIYNGKSSLALVCPVTKQAKGYPFEVTFSAGEGTTGVILADTSRALIGRRAAPKSWDAALPKLLTKSVPG